MGAPARDESLHCAGVCPLGGSGSGALSLPSIVSSGGNVLLHGESRHAVGVIVGLDADLTIAGTTIEACRPFIVLPDGQPQHGGPLAARGCLRRFEQGTADAATMRGGIDSKGMQTGDPRTAPIEKGGVAHGLSADGGKETIGLCAGHEVTEAPGAHPVSQERALLD